MISYYSADYIIPVNSEPIPNGVVGLDKDNQIVGIYDLSSIPSQSKITKLQGVLIPGFVNAHCHLELSHMLGKIPKHTGLVNFIGHIVQNRMQDEDVIQQAMEQADEYMFQQGIQAVGDHVNTTVSEHIKKKSKIIYHTFVEIISLREEEHVIKIDHARDIEFHFDHAHASITPHAPYSCSKSLFKTFSNSVQSNNIVSIHNQESEEENKLFRYKTGDFLKFYEKIGIPLDTIKAQARNSIQSYLNLLPKDNKTMLVHNTFTSVKDIDFIRRMGRKVTMCLCPNANLYIEKSLPKVDLLNDNQVSLAIGTDSLASNHTLSILDELKVLHKHFPKLDFLNTIKWATINGASALNLDHKIGTIEVGKSPGLVLLKNMENFILDDNVTLERIV